MTQNMFFALFNLGGAVGLYIAIARGLRDKQLKITLISSPMTKVEKVILTGKGLTVAMIGFGMSATLFTFSGINLLTSNLEGTSLLLMLISIFLAVVTMWISSYVN